jgi:hypothetical protein
MANVTLLYIQNGLDNGFISGAVSDDSCVFPYIITAGTLRLLVQGMLPLDHYSYLLVG